MSRTLFSLFYQSKLNVTQNNYKRHVKSLISTLPNKPSKPKSQILFHKNRQTKDFFKKYFEGERQRMVREKIRTTWGSGGC